VALNAKAFGNEEDERRQSKPQQPVRQLPDEHFAQRRRLLEKGNVMVGKEIVIERKR